jgi:hypothetical protein
MTVEHAQPTLTGTPTPTCAAILMFGFCGQPAVAVVGVVGTCGCKLTAAPICESCLSWLGREGDGPTDMCASCGEQMRETWIEPVRLRVATER